MTEKVFQKEHGCMTLQQWATQKGWTWQTVAKQLSDICRILGESPIYNNRLNRLRSGKARARSHEIQALLKLTGNDADTFIDDVEDNKWAIPESNNGN